MYHQYHIMSHIEHPVMYHHIMSRDSHFFQRHLENSRRRGEWGSGWEEQQAREMRDMRDIQVRSEWDRWNLSPAILTCHKHKHKNKHKHKHMHMHMRDIQVDFACTVTCHPHLSHTCQIRGDLIISYIFCQMPTEGHFPCITLKTFPFYE